MKINNDSSINNFSINMKVVFVDEFGKEYPAGEAKEMFKSVESMEVIFDPNTNKKVKVKSELDKAKEKFYLELKNQVDKTKKLFDEYFDQEANGYISMYSYDNHSYVSISVSPRNFNQRNGYGKAITRSSIYQSGLSYCEENDKFNCNVGLYLAFVRALQIPHMVPVVTNAIDTNYVDLYVEATSKLSQLEDQANNMISFMKLMGY